MKIIIICASLSLLLLSGCLYKMPTRDCISTLPNINNPHVTGERPASMIPTR